MISSAQHLFPLTSRLNDEINKFALRADKPQTNRWEFQIEDGVWHELRFEIFSNVKNFVEIIEVKAAEIDLNSNYKTITMIYLNFLDISRPYVEKEVNKVKIIILNEDEVNSFKLIPSHLKRLIYP